MKEIFEFKFYTGKQIINEGKDLFLQMKNCFASRKFDDNILNLLDDEASICCMFKNGDMVGFAWLAVVEEIRLAELCWLVTDKNKIKALEAKLLLDKSIEFCKEKGIKSLKFECFEPTWHRTKNKKQLFEKFGYNLDLDDDYDVSINLEQ